MKRINVVDGTVDVIEMNVSAEASNSHPFVVADSVEVYGGYTSNGDGTFTAPPEPSKTRDDVNVERDDRLTDPALVRLTGTVKQKTGDALVDVTDPVFYMDMRGEKDRVNLLGLTAKATLLVAAQDYTTLTPVYTADDEEYRLNSLQLASLGQQAGSHDGKIYAFARAIKLMDPIPADYATNEAYWTD